MAPKAVKAKGGEKFWNIGAQITDIYRDPFKWQLVKHTAIFFIAVIAVRELSDIDLMASPQAS